MKIHPQPLDVPVLDDIDGYGFVVRFSEFDPDPLVIRRKRAGDCDLEKRISYALVKYIQKAVGRALP